MSKGRPLLATLALVILASCGPTNRPSPAAATQTDRQLAESSLRQFFDYLSAGDYAAAAARYGGSYEPLHALNPDLDPADAAALLRNACTVNGYQCLRIRQVHEIDELSSGNLEVSVSFETAEGKLFVRGPCCGSTETETPPESVFRFAVSSIPGGGYKVMDLPIYLP